MTAQCGPTGDVCVTCEQVTGCVHVSAQAANQLARLPDGLYVPAAPGATFSAGDGVAVTGNPLDGYTVAVVPAPYGTNALRLGTDDGVHVPACATTGLSATADTPTLALDINAGTLHADARLSAQPGNILSEHPDGLHAPRTGGQASALVSGDADNALRLAGDNLLHVPACAAPPRAGEGLSVTAAGYTVGAGPGITAAADAISARLSADPGNLARLGADDGVYVPLAGCAVAAVDSTPSMGLVLTGGVLHADVRRSADPGNAVALHPGGIWVPAGDAPAAGALVSTDAGNQLRTGGDAKLYAPAPPNAPTAGAGLAVTAGVMRVATGQALYISGSEPADVLAVRRSADAGNLVRFGADNGVYAPAGASAHAFAAVTAIEPAIAVAMPATTVAQVVPVKVGTGGLVDNQSGGKITIDPGGWFVTNAKMYVNVDISCAMVADIYCEVYLGVALGPLRAHTFVAGGFSSKQSALSGAFTISTAATTLIQLTVSNVPTTPGGAGTPFTLNIHQLNMIVTWLGDAP